ncbi:hypothetical protein FHY05_000859 [Sphingomonas sp. BK580]|nr:hypothetical protein [Sphingomonas sp. BK580]
MSQIKSRVIHVSHLFLNAYQTTTLTRSRAVRRVSQEVE